MTNNVLRVLINGATGKMGQEAVHAVSREPDFIIVEKLNRKENLAKALSDTQAQIAVDFTCASVAYENTKTIIEHHVHPVIGTTGLSLAQIQSLQALCNEKKLGGIIAPNFSLGSALMMLLAKQAVKFFPNCEIIEMHHNNKKDAPSGTALKTVSFMDLKGKEVPIHSVRLPGLVAHQEILFGGHHELLTIRHDTFNRAAFMPGLLLAMRNVIMLEQLLYGLENLILNAKL